MPCPITGHKNRILGSRYSIAPEKALRNRTLQLEITKIIPIMVKNNF